MNVQHAPTFKRQRGVGLVEPLISIAVLAIGILGIAQFQFGMLAQSTDSQARIVASAFADEIATQMRVDSANAACYTLPQEGTCGSALASDATEEWAARVEAGLPGFVDVTAAIDGTQYVATLRWTSKAFRETRQLEIRTDVRP